MLLKPPKEASLPFPSMSRRVFVKLGMAAVAGGPLPAQVSTESAGAMSAQSQGSTLLVTHEAFLDHLTNTPERPARMKVIDAALSDQAFSALRRESARERKMTQHLFRTYFGTRRNIIERRALVAERAAPLGQ